MYVLITFFEGNMKVIRGSEIDDPEIIAKYIDAINSGNNILSIGEIITERCIGTIIEEE